MDDAAENLARDYLAAFGTPAGRKVLAHLRQLFGERLSYVAGDPHATAFREGQRSVILHINALLSWIEERAPSRASVQIESTIEEE